jgi:hypothetical protein
MIAGCHGGNSSGLPALTAPNGAHASARVEATPGSGTLVVVLPAIVPAAPLPTPPPVGTYLLSSGTRTISGTFGKVTFGPLDISAGSKNCQAAAGGRTCTIQVPVPAGTSDLRLLTYGAQASFGPLALMGKTRVLIRPGVLNYAPPLRWFGIAHKVKITATPRTLTQFKPSQSILTIYGIDGSEAPIPESGLVDASSAGFSTTTVATGAYKQSPDVKNFTPFTWTYDGRFAGTETFTTTGYVRKKAVATASVTLTITPGNSSSIGQILAASVAFPGSSDVSIVEFTNAALGNVDPLRNVQGVAAPYGMQSDGSFWMLTNRYDTIGDVLGRIAPPKPGQVATASAVDAAQNEYVAYEPANDNACSQDLHIYVFAANSYGKTTTRDIQSTLGCSASDLTVDGAGVMYAYIPPSFYGKAAGTVYEFAPNTSGNVPPERTIPDIFLANLVGDKAGNLYALYSATASGTPSNLVVFAPGATTWKPVLPGVTVSAFTLDSKGNIYAEVPVSSTAFQVEVFPAGSTTASRVIGGSKTTLTIPAGIAVLP